MSDILDLLFKSDPMSTIHDITEIMMTDLRTVVQSHIKSDKESPFSVSNLSSNLFLYKGSNTPFTITYYGLIIYFHFYLLIIFQSENLYF